MLPTSGGVLSTATTAHLTSFSLPDPLAPARVALYERKSRTSMVLCQESGLNQARGTKSRKSAELSAARQQSFELLLLDEVKHQKITSSRLFYRQFRLKMDLSTKNCETHLLHDNSDDIWVKFFGKQVEFVSCDHRSDFADKVQTHRGTTVLGGVTLHKYGPTVDRPRKLKIDRGTKVLGGVTLHNYGPTVDWPFRSHQMQHVTPIDNNSALEPMSPAGALNEDDAAESWAEAVAVKAERNEGGQKEVGAAAEEMAAAAEADPGRGH
jgi:hypothetical protein